MGAVVEFVSDAFEAVGDVFEAVGDVVEDVGDVIGDVIDTVGDVVQAVIDDPLPVLLSVAGSFVGIPPMITMGALTAARGGDLEDIALSMGTAYIGSGAGGFTNSLSSTFSSTFIEAGVNETFSTVVADSITKGLINGTIAEVRGGSFEDGFAGGAVGGLVAGGIGEVGDFVKPDILELAMESGLDLREATNLYNAGTRAVSAGIASEITGRSDFATSFTNSAIGSGIDSGFRSLNSTIDEQFASAAYQWNREDPDGEIIDTTAVGAGIPDEIVGQVTVSDYGVENEADTIDFAKILADFQEARDVNNVSSSDTDEKATSDISILPEIQLSQAPQSETVYDFADLISEGTPASSAFADNVSLSEIIGDAGLSNTGFSDNASLSDVIADAGISDTGLAGDYFDETSLADIYDEEGFYDTLESVIDIAENIPSDEAPATSVEPKGALTTIAETTVPAVDLDTTAPTVVSEAPVADNLLTAGLAQDKPEGGLNTLAQTAKDKFSNLIDVKPTDFTKPLVATVGSLLKKSLSQQKRPPPRAPAQRMAQRPAGGLKMAGAKPLQSKAPPQRMDIADLIPIQRAAPDRQVNSKARVAPAKTLASGAKLSPITDIATLTSLVKK